MSNMKEMSDQVSKQLDIFYPETDCPYHDCYVFGGCPPECEYKHNCPDYDGEVLQ